MSSKLMVPQAADELARLLIELRIVSPVEIQSSLSALPPAPSVDQFLETLERRQLITPFQQSRIRKGEAAKLILGGCVLQYRNASGSFARVYRGRRIDNNEMVGIKILRDRYSDDPDTVQLFHREGEIGKRLKHPNIVPIYDVGVEQGTHFITMEFVEGGNLKDFIKIRKTLEPAEACRYGLDMSRALHYALAQGVTHRDLKATNVLLSSQGVAKLIDFGLAADESFLNRVGSPDLAQAIEYATIEKNTDAPRNDPRSDLFFLGTILYELIAGVPPYPPTRDRDERKQFSRYRDIRPISSRVSQLPWRVEAIIDRLLQINPHHRYQAPGEVAADLEAALREMGQEVSSPPGEAGKVSNARSLLCVEHRPKRQDILREYFSKHGFRVLLLGSVERALARLKSAPPRCVIFFGDATGERIVEDVRDALQATRGQNVIVAAVLSEQQDSLTDQMQNLGERALVLRPPVRLRDLRESLESRLG